MHTKEQIENAAKSSFTYAEMQKKLGYKVKGGNVYRKLKAIIIEHEIDISHFRGKAHGTSKTGSPLEKILVENSTYGNLRSLKIRLIKENIMEYKCVECGISNWNGKQLTLQLDHINGINNDHRLENLRLLCPNCHSQTPTFGGGNVKK
jgi:Zn finger protein HypA/HybF involved in hydrogenase expression